MSFFNLQLGLTDSQNNSRITLFFVSNVPNISFFCTGESYLLRFPCYPREFIHLYALCCLLCKVHLERCSLPSSQWYAEKKEKFQKAVLPVVLIAYVCLGKFYLSPRYFCTAVRSVALTSWFVELISHQCHGIAATETGQFLCPHLTCSQNCDPVVISRLSSVFATAGRCPVSFSFLFFGKDGPKCFMFSWRNYSLRVQLPAWGEVGRTPPYKMAT